MKKLALLMALMCWTGQAAAADDYRYTINPGDVLDVSVWKESDLQREVSVLPDGTISFPLVGSMNVTGKTPGEVQDALKQKISTYIPDAMVTVAVRNPNGHRIFVLGQVNRPGEYPAGNRVNVMQALAMAGGLTSFADEGRIKVLRRQGDQEVAFTFDYDDVKRGEGLENNILLQSGDVIVIPSDELF